MRRAPAKIAGWGAGEQKKVLLKLVVARYQDQFLQRSARRTVITTKIRRGPNGHKMCRVPFKLIRQSIHSEKAPAAVETKSEAFSLGVVASE